MQTHSFLAPALVLSATFLLSALATREICHVSNLRVTYPDGEELPVNELGTVTIPIGQEVTLRAALSGQCDESTATILDAPVSLAPPAVSRLLAQDPPAAEIQPIRMDSTGSARIAPKVEGKHFVALSVMEKGADAPAYQIYGALFVLEFLRAEALEAVSRRVTPQGIDASLCCYCSPVESDELRALAACLTEPAAGEDGVVTCAVAECGAAATAWECDVDSDTLCTHTTERVMIPMERSSAAVGMPGGAAASRVECEETQVVKLQPVDSCEIR